MHLTCPHCRNAINPAETLAPGEIPCPACGSSF
jgi:hypothetical protein